MTKRVTHPAGATPKRRQGESSVPLEDQILRARHPGEYAAFQYVRQRCKKFGVKLNPAWETFDTFLRSVGPRPSALHTIVCLDPSAREFGPETARWMSRKEQIARRRARKSGDSAALVGLQSHIDQILHKAALEISAYYKSTPLRSSSGTRYWSYTWEMPIAIFKIRYSQWRSRLSPKFVVFGFEELFYFLDRFEDLIIFYGPTPPGLIDGFDDGGGAAINERKYNILAGELKEVIEYINKKSPTLANFLGAAVSELDLAKIQMLRDALLSL